MTQLEKRKTFFTEVANRLKGKGFCLDNDRDLERVCWVIFSTYDDIHPDYWRGR